MGELPQARLAFEKSQLATLYSNSSQNQIALTKEKLSLDESPQEGISEYFYSGVAYFGPVKIWIAVLLVILPLLYGWKVRWKKKLWITCGVLVLIPLTLALWVQFKTNALIVLEPIAIYDGPSNVFFTDRKVEAGKKLLITWRDNWGSIIHPPSSRGWIKKPTEQQATFLWGNNQ